MELSERYIQTLEKEGFTTVSEWQHGPNEVLVERRHADKVSYLVTDGSIEFLIDGQSNDVLPGQRVNIPSNTPYSAKVGAGGVIYIMGEME
ncbi:hypothetical protein KC926_02520 [Candidatus Kaiserbacteria bacterium]|nr:hypothetical protein [Candidatus Kaiserbacteria bacterium]